MWSHSGSIGMEQVVNITETDAKFSKTLATCAAPSLRVSNDIEGR